jgi:origin recognition complex subunit 1
MSLDAFLSKYPSGKVPRQDPDHGKIFVCRRACSTRTATYTDEFIWEELYGGAGDIYNLIDFVKTKTKATRKKTSKRTQATPGSRSTKKYVLYL